MNKARTLFVGGLVAMGFDETGRFLLTVTHSGRGVFSTDSWQRVARDIVPTYPENGIVIGIGPIDGQNIKVMERNEACERINILSPDGKFRLRGESDSITVTEIDI